MWLNVIKCNEVEFGLVTFKAHCVCFEMIGKYLKISKTNSNISFQQSTKKRQNSIKKIQQAHKTGIVFVKHNDILPCSLVSTRCDSKWMRAKFEIFREPGLCLKRQDGLGWPFVWWWHNENVLWRRSGGLFLLGLLHISVQVFIVDISKLLKFSGSLPFISW